MLDVVSGTPYTTSVCSPFVIAVGPIDTRIVKDVAAMTGITPNVITVPDCDDWIVIELAELDTAEKSMGTPDVAPFASETVIVQLISAFVRAGFPATHESIEDVVGIP